MSDDTELRNVLRTLGWSESLIAATLGVAADPDRWDLPLQSMEAEVTDVSTLILLPDHPVNASAFTQRAEDH